jgi:1-deoxy-D-xylulose-5-phosphate reductoisomerase
LSRKEGEGETGIARAVVNEVKNIVLLGSTGSIGENVLRVVRGLGDRIAVKGLAANTNWERLLEQANEFGVADIALSDETSARRCEPQARGVTVHGGQEAVARLAGSDVDLVVCAIVGMASLGPVLAALKKGTTLALSSKEALVTGGRIVRETCAATGAKILPVDSEHSAIFQCLRGYTDGSGTENIENVVDRMILTASGGPFGSSPDLDLEKVSVEQVLEHPNWDMGNKVTVDSATLMNKGLEIMEAQWLFGMPLERIGVVIHPESLVHSVVQFVDGNMLAQLNPPDMRYAIQYALTFPERMNGGLEPLDLEQAGSLNFQAPDTGRFPCLSLARAAASEGGTMPAVLNAANEVAVERFLGREIRFSGIWDIVEKVMNMHDSIKSPGIDEIFAADGWARRQARNR